MIAILEPYIERYHGELVTSYRQITTVRTWEEARALTEDTGLVAHWSDGKTKLKGRRKRWGDTVLRPSQRHNARNWIDLTGKRFGRLVITGQASASGSHAYWAWMCDCGAEGKSMVTHLKDKRKPKQYCSLECPLR